MSTQIQTYPDTSAFGEDYEMSQSDVHNNLIFYLMAVWSQIFESQSVGVFTSIQLYGDPLHPDRNKSPDVLAIDNLLSTPDGEITSYYINDTNPPPRVLMEISSKDNWYEDLEQISKVGSYERMGIPEYFVCDPHPVQVWKYQWLERGRLVGWRFDPIVRRFDPIEPDEQGRLWSEGLDSWLVMEGHGNRELHLYDQSGNLRLTPEQIQQRQALIERLRADAERQQKLIAQAQADTERLRADSERQQKLIAQAQADTERQQAEAERQQKLIAQAQAEAAQQRVQELEDLLRQLKGEQPGKESAEN